MEHDIFFDSANNNNTMLHVMFQIYSLKPIVFQLQIEY